MNVTDTPENDCSKKSFTKFWKSKTHSRTELLHEMGYDEIAEFNLDRWPLSAWDFVNDLVDALVDATHVIEDLKKKNKNLKKKNKNLKSKHAANVSEWRIVLGERYDKVRDLQRAVDLKDMQRNDLSIKLVWEQDQVRDLKDALRREKRAADIHAHSAISWADKFRECKAALEVRTQEMDDWKQRANVTLEPNLLLKNELDRANDRIDMLEHINEAQQKTLDNWSYRAHEAEKLAEELIKRIRTAAAFASEWQGWGRPVDKQ